MIHSSVVALAVIWRFKTSYRAAATDLSDFSHFRKLRRWSLDRRAENLVARVAERVDVGKWSL